MGLDGHRAGSELFVCFPSRTTMSLMPKPILSPGRSGDPAKRLRNTGSRGQSSPMFSIPANGRSSKKNSEYEVEEPTSPKVTCAGQVRVKPTKQCKNWQSVMAEIEKLHDHKHRKRGSGSSPARAQVQHKWNQVVGLKKEVVQFVTALRNLRVDFGCFGAHAASTDDDEEEELEDEEECREPTSSGAVFAKWFMMLQDNDDRKQEKFQSTSSARTAGDRKSAPPEDAAQDSNPEPAVPPPNALLLMRCRSAPCRASSLNTFAGDSERKSKGKAESMKKPPELVKKALPVVVLRRCKPDFSAMVSMDVSKETWVSRRDFINQTFTRSVSLKG